MLSAFPDPSIAIAININPYDPLEEILQFPSYR